MCPSTINHRSLARCQSLASRPCPYALLVSLARCFQGCKLAARLQLPNGSHLGGWAPVQFSHVGLAGSQLLKKEPDRIIPDGVFCFVFLGGGAVPDFGLDVYPFLLLLPCYFVHLMGFNFCFFLGHHLPVPLKDDALLLPKRNRGGGAEKQQQYNKKFSSCSLVSTPGNNLSNRLKAASNFLVLN